MNIIVLAAPTAYPLTLAEAKVAARVDDDDTSQDVYLNMLLAAATRYAENYTRRAYCNRTLEVSWSEWPYYSYGGYPSIELPKPPLIAVQYMKYTDTAGVEQTIDPADYQVDDRREPAVIMPAYQKWWPALRCGFNALKIAYTCGYQVGSPLEFDDEAKDKIASLRLWMAQRITSHYEERGPIIAGTIVAELPRSYVDGLLDELIVRMF